MEQPNPEVLPPIKIIRLDEHQRAFVKPLVDMLRNGQQAHKTLLSFTELTLKSAGYPAGTISNLDIETLEIQVIDDREVKSQSFQTLPSPHPPQ